MTLFYLCPHLNPEIVHPPPRVQNWEPHPILTLTTSKPRWKFPFVLSTLDAERSIAAFLPD